MSQPCVASTGPAYGLVTASRVWDIPCSTHCALPDATESELGHRSPIGFRSDDELLGHIGIRILSSHLTGEDWAGVHLEGTGTPLLRTLRITWKGNLPAARNTD